MSRPRCARARSLAAVLTAVAAFAAIVPATPAAAGIPLTAPPSAAFAGDAPDPHVVRDGATFYAFTTGTTWGNHIGVLTSNRPDGGWRPLTHVGSSAFRSPSPSTPPSPWQVANTQLAPGAFRWNGQWLLYYSARNAATGKWCLSVATAPSPAAKFTDRSGGRPWYCDDALGGVVDPAPFVDAGGRPWLTWKSNDGGSPQPARLWSAPLTSNGLGLAAAPSLLVDQDTTTFPWQTTIENPQMVVRGGTYFLFLSANRWDSTDYAMTYAICSGPAGPCTQPSRAPWLASYGSVRGPGGGAVFADANGRSWLAYHGWPTGCTSYACGGARQMYVAPLQFPAEQVRCTAPSTRDGYRMVGADGAVFTFGTLPYCGAMAGAPLTGSVAGIAPTRTGGGYWLAGSDGTVFAFGDARWFGNASGLRAGERVASISATKTGNGYWLFTDRGRVLVFGDASHYGDMAGVPLNGPVLGSIPTATGRGYWMVASDGGIFSFGDARFYGSMGGRPLNAPVMGIVADPDGRGYWLVAFDGGIFAFDAPFRGSMGGQRLNRPVIGMVAYGNGYLMVGADGGIFTFSNRAFRGSLGTRPPDAPIVAVAT